MGNDAIDNKQEIVFDCGTQLQLETVCAYKLMLVNALLQRQHVVFFAKQLRNIDAAALQLLIFYAHNAKSQGLHFSWKEPSKSLIHAANLIGANQLLNLPGDKESHDEH